LLGPRVSAGQSQRLHEVAWAYCFLGFPLPNYA
jgi:hypothetical protein